MVHDYTTRHACLTDESPGRRLLTHRRATAMLVAAAMVLGIYHIAWTTGSTMVAGDTTRYVAIARGLYDEPGNTLRTNVLPPGYPALILIAQGLLRPLLSGLTHPLDWAVSAQIVSLAGFCATIWLVARLGSALAGERAGLLGTAAVVFLPYPVAYGVDGLSDFPALAMVAGASLLTVRAIQRDRARLLPWVGLLAAAGYYIRPEALVLGLFPALVVAGLRAVRTASAGLRRRWVLGSAVAALLAGAIILPYLVYMGSVIPKKQPPHRPDVLAYRDMPTKTEPVVEASVVSTVRGIGESVIEVADRLLNVMEFYFAVFLVVGMVVWLRRRHTEGLRSWLVVLLTTSALMLVWHNFRFGYTSKRHLLPLAVTPAGVVGLGIESTARSIHAALIRHRSRAAGFGTKRWAIVLVVAGLAARTPSTLKPLHIDRTCQRSTAEKLTKLVEPGQRVAIWDGRIAFYARLDETVTMNTRVWPRTLYNWIREERVHWMVARYDSEDADDPVLRMIAATGSEAFEAVHRCTQDRRIDVVFRLRPDKLGPQPPAKPLSAAD
ncbi:MAG: glycosyltransferase family 39 protein [Phycisphaerae bacterium]